MSRPVERWLGTFMCTQYADTFEAHGYKTLQSVCQLDFHQLQSMGVRPEHYEKIMENVSVLRQSYIGVTYLLIILAAGTDEVADRRGWDFHDINPVKNPAISALINISRNINKKRGKGMGPSHGMSDYPVTGQIPPAPRFPYNQNQMYSGPSYNSYVSNQIDSQMGMDGNQLWQKTDYTMQGPYGDQGQHGGQYNMNAAQYRPNQQHYSGQNRMYSGGGGMQGMADNMQNCGMQQSDNNQHNDGLGNSAVGSMPAGSNSRPARQGSASSMQSTMASNVCGGHMSVSQSPQQVADSILQMASSNYQGNPPHKMAMSTRRYRHSFPVGSMPSSQQQFSMTQPPRPYCYPANPGVGSPLSPVQVRSPAAVPNSLTSASPSPLRSPMGSLPEHCPMPSPVMTGMQSPVSNMRQPMCSPVQGNPPLSACSPVPHINVAAHPSSSPGQHVHPSTLPPSSPMSQMNPNSHPSPSPLSQIKSTGQLLSVMSPGHPSGMNFSPDSSVQHSSKHLYQTDCYPSGSSSHAEYLSYTSTSSPRQYTELQPVCRPSTSTSATYGSQYSTKCGNTFNPLQSLQKLVMLPESQVIDPKSVVSDANMLSPEGSKYDDGCCLMPDLQGTSASDNQFPSNREYVCSDGKHCGTDVEDELDSKFSILDTDTSKDDNSKTVGGTSKKARTRKKCLRKVSGDAACDNQEIITVTSESEQSVKQKILRRRGRKQQTENSEQRMPSSKSRLSSDQVASDQGSLSDSVHSPVVKSPTTEKSQMEAEHSKRSLKKDLLHYSETSIRHCTVELEDISPLKNGKTQLNGFSDYTLFDAKSLGCGKLINPQGKRCHEQLDRINQNDVKLDADLKLSPRAQRIKKRNQNLNLDDTELSSPVKQNGIHRPNRSPLLQDKNGDQSKNMKSGDKSRNLVKSLFNGKCSERLGSLQLNGCSPQIISPEKNDSTSNKHKATLLPSETKTFSSSAKLTSPLHFENGVSSVLQSEAALVEKCASSSEGVEITTAVSHSQSSMSTSVSFINNSVDCHISKNQRIISQHNINMEKQDTQKLSSIERYHHLTQKTTKHELRDQEIPQNNCIEAVTTENTTLHVAVGNDTDDSNIVKTSEEQNKKIKIEDTEKSKGRIQCNGMYIGHHLKLEPSVQIERLQCNKLVADVEEKTLETVKKDTSLELKTHQNTEEVIIYNKYDGDGTGVRTHNIEVDDILDENNMSIKFASETHPSECNSNNVKCQFIEEKQQEMESVESKTSEVITEMHSNLEQVLTTKVGKNSDEIVNLNSVLLSPGATEQSYSECDDREHFDLEKCETKMNGFIKEGSGKNEPMIKQVCTEPQAGESISASDGKEYSNGICNGMSPTNSDSPAKASDKENPLELDMCKGRRRRNLTLASKCLDYSSDENIDVKEAKVPKRKRRFGSRSPKLSCVENKDRDKSFLAVSLSTLSGVKESARATNVKNRNSIIECNSKPVVLKEKKSSLDLIVNRLSQHVVEKQLLTVAPVYVLSSHNKHESDVDKTSTANACNHASNRRMLRNSSTKALHSNSVTCKDSDLSKIVASHDAVNESRDVVKQESQSVEDDCNLDIPCPVTGNMEVLSEVISENNACGIGDEIKTKVAVEGSLGECNNVKPVCEDEHSNVEPKVLNDLEIRQPKTHDHSSVSPNKTKNGPAHGSNGIRVRSKSRRTKKRFRTFSEVGSEDEKLRKIFKIKSERKGRKDQGKQDNHLSKGPYVKITSSKELSESFEVVNLCHGDTDKQSKLLKGYSKPESHLDSSSEALMKMSSNSSWVCVFCGRRSNEDGTGDLFGPYFLDVSSAPLSPIKSRDSQNPKTSFSGDVLSVCKSRAKKKTSPSDNKSVKGRCYPTVSAGQKIKTLSPSAKGNKKVKLNNPVSGQTGSPTEFCSVCKNSGATLGCFQKACNQKYHYLCALNTDCYMDEENFSLLCQRHKVSVNFPLVYYFFLYVMFYFDTIGIKILLEVQMKVITTISTVVYLFKYSRRKE
ncbi:hypothetical protein LSH36_179g04069 [Paralvinella palmiformis]|uniref:PHD-type domain-containing protein n=1 Tax=Paralvinella palmiformis TaxID=53620 RepID=A0AAD9N8G8_9ANNE|nr:hypothetical protein LSH36_179g04069 [Paralvinella palmiformis]